MKADVFKATLEAQEGKPYVWGTEGPYSFDCSGLHWYGYRAADVRQNGKPFPPYRGTADDFKNMARPTGGRLQVGDPFFFLGNSGTAYHVASFVGYDQDGFGWTVEARSRYWGVVKVRLDDPVHGVVKRGGRPYRYANIDMGELTEGELLTPEEHNWLQEVRQMVAPKQSFCSAITNAILIGDMAEAKRLNDEFWQKWPEGVSGLPRGWSP